MGYYIRELPLKKSKPAWKVQFVSYKKGDVKKSSAKKPKKEWDIRKDRWRALGFHSLMTIDEAKVRSRQLNAQRFIKEQEKILRLREQRRNEKLLRFDSCLPAEFVVEFEKRFIRIRDSETMNGLRRKSRAHGMWSAAQRMIVAIQVEPSEWFYHAHEINDYFDRCRYSLRYIHAILKIANLWGFFFSRKLAQPFLPIPTPKGYERMRLIEANYEKDNKSVSRPSKPLLPEQLESVSGKLNQINFNWLFLSVWFGLRPQEVDNLKDKQMWRVEVLANGRKILSVYQTKIVALPPEDRWKPIPIIFDQQKFSLMIIESGSFRRPIMKTMRKHFDAGTCLYAGRKGFSDLMLSKGQSFENISIWMGHSTLERTWRSYKNRRKFHLKYY